MIVRQLVKAGLKRDEQHDRRHRSAETRRCLIVITLEIVLQRQSCAIKTSRGFLARVHFGLKGPTKIEHELDVYVVQQTELDATD